MLEARIHGYGGQGAVTMAHLLAITALKVGKISQALPFFGSERRGSPVKACVRFSDEKIKIRSQSIRADYLIVMNPKLLQTAIGEGTKKDATIIMNTLHPAKLEYPFWYLDAESIAEENDLVVNGMPFINIPMFGAACRVFGFDKVAMEEVLRDKWQGKVADKNVKAALTAYDQVRKFEE